MSEPHLEYEHVSRSVGGGRVVAAIVLAALFPVALIVPAVAALAVVAGFWVALHAYEPIWWREPRAETRALRLPRLGVVMSRTAPRLRSSSDMVNTEGGVR